jgi:hypothetical protein
MELETTGMASVQLSTNYEQPTTNQHDSPASERVFAWSAMAGAACGALTGATLASVGSYDSARVLLVILGVVLGSVIGATVGRFLVCPLLAAFGARRARCDE